MAPLFVHYKTGIPCIYGGLHAGEESHIPCIPCYCKSAIEFPRTREVSALRWPRGCRTMRECMATIYFAAEAA